MALKLYKIDRKFESVYHYLKSNGFSENFITNLRKKEGFIKVNGEVVNIRKRLNKDDVLEIENSPNNKTAIMHCILALDIVYEDKYYLLINKPSNLSSMPNKSHYTNNLAGAICYYYKDKDDFVLRMINRLDKDTSGLILIAKDSISQKDIKNINKTYHAVCEGKIEKDLIVNKKIDTISNNGINERKRIISDYGKDAITYIHPIKFNNEYSLVELNLIHGRTHQIRLHLSSINHPLIGDELYGRPSDLINHTCLICKKLSFYHPYLNKELSFEIDYPKDAQDLLNKTILN